MQTSTIRLYSLNYAEIKTYLTVALFIAGNIILPQLFHLMPQGGVTWLPICYRTAPGTLGERAIKGDFYLAIQDFRIGLPGMLLQILGGYLFIRYLIKR